MASGNNIETWHVLHRATMPSTFTEAENLLIDTVVFTRTKRNEVNHPINNGIANYMIPIPTLNYVLICATKVFMVTSGTYELSLISSSTSPITIYIQNEQDETVESSYLPEPFSGQERPFSVEFDANTEYTIMIVQGNASMNHSLFVQSRYTGLRLPRNKAYVGGAAITLKATSSSVIAVGDFKWSARHEDFDGWLLCNGRAVYRDAYPALFITIGTSFGAGNGTTTFNIPDGRSRVAGAVGQGFGLSSRAMGASIGEERHTLSYTEMPSHNHTGTTTTDGNHSHGVTDPGHAHTQTTINDDYNSSGANPPGFAADSAGTKTWSNINSATTGVSIDDAGNHNHTFTTDSTGNGNAHNVMQPTLFIGHLYVCAEI